MSQPLHPLQKFQLEVRVRYQETDAQGRVHHATYPNYFECARVEMLRAAGISYAELEAQGVLLVVTELGCNYRGGAVFDDLLVVEVETVRARGTRIEHQYTIRRGDEVLVTGNTVVACINPQGRPRPLPDYLSSIPTNSHGN
ncbi:MAG: acyl-CoA thioesterase [Planctomycetaceae bacterium]|nr:acyl-CoA thioesterase [Planctomycetaceae bacterium]